MEIKHKAVLPVEYITHKLGTHVRPYNMYSFYSPRDASFVHDGKEYIFNIYKRPVSSDKETFDLNTDNIRIGECLQIGDKLHRVADVIVDINGAKTFQLRTEERLAEDGFSKTDMLHEIERIELEVCATPERKQPLWKRIFSL